MEFSFDNRPDRGRCIRSSGTNDQNLRTLLFGSAMSRLGQKRRLLRRPLISSLPQSCDMIGVGQHVSLVPIMDGGFRNRRNHDIDRVSRADQGCSIGRGVDHLA